VRGGGEHGALDPGGGQAPGPALALTGRRSLLLLALLALGACGERESGEHARIRATESFLVGQIADLKGLIARAEAGELSSPDRIAIGISEDVAGKLLDASLPREALLGQRLRVRIESARPSFRGNAAGLVFQATARSVDFAGATARLELGGSLQRFRIDGGRLVASVELGYVNVLDASVGGVAGDALQDLVTENLSALAALVPGFEIPVQLRQSVEIDGLEHGVVQTRGGALPLQITVADVIPVNQRLWVYLDARAGPWQGRPASPTSR
jgi:hypothetical protein